MLHRHALLTALVTCLGLGLTACDKKDVKNPEEAASDAGDSGADEAAAEEPKEDEGGW